MASSSAATLKMQAHDPTTRASVIGITHFAWGLAWPPARKVIVVRFTTTAAIVHELMEAQEEKQLLRFQKLGRTAHSAGVPHSAHLHCSNSRWLLRGLENVAPSAYLQHSAQPRFKR